MHNQAHKSINTNLWENNSHLETLLKSKWGAEKECPIGPHDSFAPSPPLCSAPVSHTAGRPCLPILLKPAVWEFPVSALLATKKTPSAWFLTHFSSCILHLSEVSSPRLTVKCFSSEITLARKCKEKKSQKEKLQTKALLSPVTQTLSKSYMGVAQPTKTEPQHLPNRRLVSAHSTPHSAALLP